MGKKVRHTRTDTGFSLVELIVVIAIMAVLVGVLAPAYLRYVEKARKSGDVDAVDQIMQAALIVATDEEFYVPLGAEFHMEASNGEISLSIPVWNTVASAGGIARGDVDWDRTEDEWRETSNQGNPYRMRSKAWSNGSGKAVGTLVTADGLTWVVVNSEGVFQEMINYSTSLANSFSSSEE